MTEIRRGELRNWDICTNGGDHEGTGESLLMGVEVVLVLALILVLVLVLALPLVTVLLGGLPVPVSDPLPHLCRHQCQTP